MIKGVLICILLLLAISGICDIIHSVRSWLISSERPRNNISVIYLKEGTALSQLKYIAEQYRWYGTDFAEYYIAVTDELKNNDISDLEKAFAESVFIFCPSSAVPNVIKSLMKGK